MNNFFSFFNGDNYKGILSTKTGHILTSIATQN